MQRAPPCTAGEESRTFIHTTCRFQARASQTKEFITIFPLGDSDVQRASKLVASRSKIWVEGADDISNAVRESLEKEKTVTLFH
jgi:hypothetical protein